MITRQWFINDTKLGFYQCNVVVGVVVWTKQCHLELCFTASVMYVVWVMMSFGAGRSNHWMLSECSVNCFSLIEGDRVWSRLINWVVSCGNWWLNYCLEWQRNGQRFVYISCSIIAWGLALDLSGLLLPCRLHLDINAGGALESWSLQSLRWRDLQSLSRWLLLPDLPAAC